MLLYDILNGNEIFIGPRILTYEVHLFIFEGTVISGTSKDLYDKKVLTSESLNEK
jgi:hypothetical protein